MVLDIPTTNDSILALECKSYKTTLKALVLSAPFFKILDTASHEHMPTSFMLVGCICWYMMMTGSVSEAPTCQ